MIEIKKGLPTTGGSYSKRISNPIEGVTKTEWPGRPRTLRRIVVGGPISAEIFGGRKALPNRIPVQYRREYLG